MIEKKSQAIIKRDTEENFRKCFGKKYIPVHNVIILIDKPDGTIDLRVGDGETYIEDLPNLLSQNNNSKWSNASVTDEEELLL